MTDDHADYVLAKLSVVFPNKTLTVEEVKGFLKQMDEDDEFDDFELDIVALAAIAGGGRSGGNC